MAKVRIKSEKSTSFSKAMIFLLLYVLWQILLELVSPFPFFSEPYHEVQLLLLHDFLFLMPYYILSLKILLAKIQIITDYVTHSICIYIYALLNVLHYLYYHGLLNKISRNHDICPHQASMLLSYVLLDDVKQRFTIVAIKITCPADEAVNAFFSRCFQLA